MREEKYRYEELGAENKMIEDSLIHNNKDSASLSQKYLLCDKFEKEIVHVPVLTVDQAIIYT